MNLQKKIWNLCNEKGITLNVVESACGFGKNTIYKWGTHDPSISKVKKVADYFCMGVDDLIEMEEACEE